ncbi:uncharacterized protein LOC127712505 [Mytilus californianus]|uniref:uncharacterized protein LOC127712505 n=1 Tax=Mytilus californianus TaxID=6549 RepID=UPI002245E491|nr:uncharacterized protein LOC127712505 [Mytilus californianus]
MKTKSSSSQLVVRNLVVSVKTKHILYGVNTGAQSGDLLAIMGPTGSGKTTLLNAIAGRVQSTSGEITMNGQYFNKHLRRRLGYVLQDDVFMPSLTLYETLYFTAMIRIAESVSLKDKQTRIDDIVQALDLKKCLHTVIGDFFVRGLSGGEKKRANIACEFLTDPDIMLIDEPTSGLDSTTAHKLMIQLKNYVTQYNKTIIATIHQPSSQVYHMFSKLLLLMDGKVAYFGKASEALNYFERIGMPCAIHFNPADFLLALLSTDDETSKKIHEEADRHKKFENVCEQNPLSNGQHSHVNHSYTNNSDADISKAGLRTGGSAESFDDVCVVGIDKEETSVHSHHAWPTSFWTQYRMLTWRQFRQSKGRILHKYEIIQSILLALLGGILYFQTDYSYRTLRDKMGTIFFSVAHWGFNCMLGTVTGFPSERGVIKKEREAGAYRLSAYYAAKITSDLPLILIAPILFYSIIYWMSAVGDGILFSIFIGVNLLFCTVAQSIGHIIGTAMPDMKLSLTTVTTYMLFSLLFSGYFNTHLPDWVNWAKYLSIVHYAFGCLNILSTEGMHVLWCNTTSAELNPSCIGNTTFITITDVLKDSGIDCPYFCYIASLGILFIVLRVLGYYVMKWKR